jgi:hypothetical protein
MKNNKRTYMHMNLEEALIESGRYNVDYALQSKLVSPMSLLDGFRSTAARLGSEFNLPSPSGLGVAKLRNTDN